MPAALGHLGIWVEDWAAFLTKEVYRYPTIFGGIAFNGWNNLAPHLYKSLSLQWKYCLKNTSPVRCKLKVFFPPSACFWSCTLYTVLFDHACRRLPRHQSTVWDRIEYPTVTLARYLPVWLGIIWFIFFSDSLFAPHRGCLLFIISVFNHGSLQPRGERGAPYILLKSASSWGMFRQCLNHFPRKATETTLSLLFLSIFMFCGRVGE